MPIRINLKEIFPSDPQEINVEKLNFNFNKLLELGVGTPGSIGLTGPQGPAGPIGSTGPQGIRGATWWVDANSPTTHTFTGLLDGDLYLNNDNFDIYQWDAGTSTWILEVELSAIIDSYLISNGSPFVKTFGSDPNDRFIAFGVRNSTSDSNRGSSNSSLNNILYLNNFDETNINSYNIEDLYTSLLTIVTNHSDQQPSLTADLGRYHIELGSLYTNDNGSSADLSNINHNLKIKFYKDYYDLANNIYLPLTNEWINTAKFSLSVPEDKSLVDIDQNGIFNFLTPKWNNEATSFRAELSTLIGPAESFVEQGTNFQHIVADGITLSLTANVPSPLSINSTLGLAYNYNSAYTRLDTSNLMMVDTNSSINGILLNDKTYIIGNTNVIGKVSIGDIDPTTPLHILPTASDYFAESIIKMDVLNVSMAALAKLDPTRFYFIDLQSDNIIRGGGYSGVNGRDNQTHYYSITSGDFNSNSQNITTYYNDLYFSKINLGDYYREIAQPFPYPPLATYHTDNITGDLYGSSIQLGTGMNISGSTILYNNIISGGVHGSGIICNNTSINSTQITGDIYGNKLSITYAPTNKIFGSYLSLSSPVNASNTIYGNYFISNADTQSGAQQYGSYINVTNSSITDGILFGSMIDLRGGSNDLVCGLNVYVHPGRPVANNVYGITVDVATPTSGTFTGTTYGLHVVGADENYLEGSIQLNSSSKIKNEWHGWVQLTYNTGTGAITSHNLYNLNIEGFSYNTGSIAGGTDPYGSITLDTPTFSSTDNVIVQLTPRYEGGAFEVSRYFTFTGQVNSLNTINIYMDAWKNTLSAGTVQFNVSIYEYQ